MNIEKLSKLSKECIELGFKLPRSGHFSESKNVFRLVNRKNMIRSIYDDIFEAESFEEFFDEIQEAVQNNQYMGVEFNDVKVYVGNSQKGFRFLDKSEWFLKFVIENETDLYKIAVPLHKNNLELYLHGILPLAEPSRFLDWSEYAFVSKSKVTTKETRLHLKFAYSYRASKIQDISPQEYFYLTRLEDVMLQVFSMFNNRRLKDSELDIQKFDLLRNWCKIQVEQQAKNEIDSNPPVQKIDICEAWQSFDSFVSWAIQNGYEKESLLIRKNENEPYEPNNCFWSSEQDQLVERYYWNPAENNFLTGSKFLNMMVEVGGEMKSFAELEDSTGIPYYVLIGRYFSGHKGEELLNPITKKAITYLHQDITINGVTRTTKEWAELVGITPNTIVSRIRYGWYGESLIAPPRKKEG